MIESIGRVMLYVKDPRQAADFWVQKIGFIEIGVSSGPDSSPAIEISPGPQADTSFMLFQYDAIAKYHPELSLGTPSILFSSRNLDSTRLAMLEKGVKVGELVQMQGMRSFHFEDNEGNYFAVRETG